MRLHIIVDVNKQDDNERSKPGDEIIGEFENELASIQLEVSGTVYDIDVRGIGKTAKEAGESYKLRNTGRKS